MGKRHPVIGYINQVMSPEVLAQNPVRFHQAFREAVTLKPLRDTSLLKKIPDKSLKLNFIHRKDCILLSIVLRAG